MDWMGYFGNVNGVIPRDKVRSCEIRKDLNVDLLLLQLLYRDPSYVASPIYPKCSQMIGEARSAGST